MSPALHGYARSDVSQSWRSAHTERKPAARPTVSLHTEVSRRWQRPTTAASVSPGRGGREIDAGRSGRGPADRRSVFRLHADPTPLKAALSGGHRSATAVSPPLPSLAAAPGCVLSAHLMGTRLVMAPLQAVHKLAQNADACRFSE